MSIKKMQILIFIGALIHITLSLLKFNNPLEKYKTESEIGIFLLVVYLIIIFFAYKTKTKVKS
ncbi:hypothetical protein Amet_0113 [Alkaliphilus metalliredigens QYMF]|uniref:Uncharacterized protein n=1 Tax=Alkaliphilus metalliredigens (strain QYMF) TaxID=293826 RepID=A6TJI6_ALKMQ|nr:hypothetical protein [Alkaliphilus metalliredigens]ABR46354.1 hypothetical protein Amet_0113 [Alkaliphilus metalliredigens QYMF]